MAVTDLHAHVTPACLLDSLERGSTLHGIEPKLIAKGLLRRISPAQRLADMSRLGIQRQVLSPEPQVYCYQFDGALTAAIHRECNDEIADLSSKYPEAFSGLGVLPMQDVPLAIAELIRVRTELDLSGVMIGDHVNGALYDEPQFRPFWRAVEDLGAIVFLHQASPTLVASRTKRYHLANTVGNAVERTIDVAAIIFGGLLDEFPTLKICLGHGGGYTCFGAGRLDWGWRWRPSARAQLNRTPSSYLRHFYYDCITHDEHALRFIIDTVGVDRVVFGTDYPGFAAGAEGVDYDPTAWLLGLTSLTAAEKQAILVDTPAALLNLPISVEDSVDLHL